MEQARSLRPADRITFDEWIDGADGPMPEAMMRSPMRARLPKDWKDVARVWAAREGSIAGIDIVHTLKHARFEQQHLSTKRERDAKNEHGMAGRRDLQKSSAPD